MTEMKCGVVNWIFCVYNTCIGMYFVYTFN